jgi:hypothetical protein
VLFGLAVARTYAGHEVSDGIEAMSPFFFLAIGGVVLISSWRLARKARYAPFSHVAAASALIIPLHVGLSYLITNRSTAVITDFIQPRMLFTILAASMLGYLLSRLAHRKAAQL